MTKGYFLCKGDKTSCGGEILSGDFLIKWHGRAAAREGDKVTCGKHSGIYTIVGGISNMNLTGQPLAGTLDSRSSCPCRAQLLPATHVDTYLKEDIPVAPAQPYGGQLVFHCRTTGEPVSDFAYSLQVGNQEINGVTDHSGESQYFRTQRSEEIRINYLIQTRIGI